MVTRRGEEGGSDQPAGRTAGGAGGRRHGMEWHPAWGGNRGGVSVGQPEEKGERPGPGGIVTFQNYSKIFIFELIRSKDRLPVLENFQIKYGCEGN
jgi:hypothetical protein